MTFDLELIVSTAIRIIRETQIFIQQEILEDPASAFEEIQIGRRNKPLLAVDLIAEKIQHGIYAEDLSAITFLPSAKRA